MARRKTKSIEEVKNPYKKARLLAAERNDAFSTVEKACEELTISRDRLGQIEQEEKGFARTDPHPDEVAMMIRAYNAPELQNAYCTQICPLGGGMPELKYESLSDICLHLILSLHRISRAQTKLGDILDDGEIADGEKEEFIKVLRTLKSISQHTESLELWAKKNGILKEEI